MIIDELFESPQQCPECGGISFSDLILAEKKDACYHKVKASAKVWPSAYASGRLVQCRKKGAANYGNKSEGVAEAGFPGAPDVEMPPMNPSGDPQRDKLKQEYMDLHREIKSLVDLQYRSTSDEQKMQAKARIEQLNDRADQIKAILEPRQPPNEWQKKTYGFDDNWNKVNQGVAEGSEQKPAITYKDYTLQYDYQTEDDDPEGYSTATTYYFDVLKDGDRVGEAEYFDYFGNLTIRINGKTKEFGFRHPLASQISQLVSSLPDEQKKDLSDPKFESQGVAEGQLELNTPDPVVVVQDLKGKILDKINLSVAAQKYKLGPPQNIKTQLAHQNYTTIGNYVIVSPMSGQPQDQTTIGQKSTFATTEGEQQKGADYRDPKEVDYDDEYDAMVARVKKLAGLGPMKTTYDPAKRVYRNVPTAVQPKK